MSQRDLEEILDLFDQFSLESPEERRIALLTLNDYIGAVFAEVGDQLDFRSSDYGMSVGHQWDKARARLEDVDSIEIPGEYGQALQTINQLRGDYAHNFDDYPPQDPIESARGVVTGWTEWIKDSAVEYEQYQESLTATEALVQVGERTINESIDNWRDYPQQFAERVGGLEKQAENLEDNIQAFRKDDEVTKELVDTISGILEWEREKKQLDEDVERWEKEEAERREQLNRYENTYNFIVVDNAEDRDEITVVKSEIGESDDMFSFYIPDCQIPEDEMEALRNLEVNDEVQLWIGRRMYRDSNGNIAHQNIVKGVEGLDTTPTTPTGTKPITDWL